MNAPLALIVEDDEDINEIFCQALASAGFSIHSVRDGQAALEFLKGVPPDVVILDLHLPNVSGEVILKTIRATPGMENTRVVITTADAAFGEYLQDKADFVMIKPISYVQLRDLTRRLNPSTQTDRLKPHSAQADG